MDAEILIVGAGPTGLALATTLQQAGIAPLVVDKRTSAVNTSRAAVIHAHTLDVLEALGVSGRLAEEGRRLARFSIRDRDGALVRRRFDVLPSYAESFVLADIDMTWGYGHDEVMLFFSPAGLLVVAPLPGGAYPLVATLDDAPEHPGVADGYRRAAADGAQPPADESSGLSRRAAAEIA
jgi:glycine/D-amino acid oxidase-like deaminating enzyme